MDGLTAWLLDADPAIRWQVMRDLADAPTDEVAAERARVVETGWGRRLLELLVVGQWAGGACFPSHDWRPPGQVFGDPEGQPWTATLPTLRLLRHLGIEPDHPDVRAAIEGVREHCRWEYAGEPFFEGEVEPCINGGAVEVGAYFGEDVDGIVERLLGEQLADGGWNCEAERGSTRSSFHSTICVLEGLLEYERGGGAHTVAAARSTGEEYLLSRSLCHRASTGDVADPDWLLFSFPAQWHYDVLRGLEYFRSVGGTPDPRLAGAVSLVRDKQQDDGSWLLENTHPGLVHFHLEDGDGRPSRWNTLRALRVLRWADPPAATRPCLPVSTGADGEGGVGASRVSRRVSDVVESLPGDEPEAVAPEERAGPLHRAAARVPRGAMHEQQRESGVDVEPVGGHRIGEGGLHDVLDRVEDDAVCVGEGAVEGSPRRELIGESRQGPGQVRDLEGDRLLGPGAESLDPVDQRPRRELQVGADLARGPRGGDLEDPAARSPALGGEILREGGERTHLHELGLRDEGAPALGALEAAVDDELGDRLAHRRP